MKYWRVYWLALDYSPRSRLTGIHQFNFFNFSLFFKDSDGLSLAHNSTEETSHDRTPPHHSAPHKESPLAFLETLWMKGQNHVGCPAPASQDRAGAGEHLHYPEAPTEMDPQRKQNVFSTSHVWL